MVFIIYGVVLGKVSCLQLLVIGFFEVVFYGINELIVVEFFKYLDVGGFIIIYIFGVYFGLVLFWVFYIKDVLESFKEGFNY